MSDEELVRTTAAFLGLEIEAAHLPGVIVNTRILHRHALLFLDFQIEAQACAEEFHP